MAIATSPAERALSMYRDLAASVSPEATLEEFRLGFDTWMDGFGFADDAVITEVWAGGVRSLLVTVDKVPAERTILHLHGGGYMTGNPEGFRDLCVRLARAARAEVLVPDYRLAPEHPHPAAVEDALAAYRYLLAEGRRASSISVVGDSAGGGLAVATAVALREAGVAGPAALICFSPWVDMEAVGQSLNSKADADPAASRDMLLMCAQAYLQGQDPCTPLANPLYADLRGLPPLLIQVGSEEVLLDDSVRLAGRAGEAEVNVTLKVQPGMPHVYPLFASFVPESQEAIERAASFAIRWAKPNG